MRREYNSALKKLFNEKFTKQFPKFVETKVRSPFGFKTYIRSVREGRLSIFLILAPDLKREAFTLEVGWTDQSPIPVCPKRGWPSRERSEYREPEFVCRLGNLFGHDDYWWSVEPDATADVGDFVALAKRAETPISPDEASRKLSPLIDDAIDKFATFGLPYLEACVKAKQ